MRWQMVSGNPDNVREARHRGEYADASRTAWGRLDDLMALAEGVGIRRELHGLHPELTRAGSIPRWFIPQARLLRTGVGEESLHAMHEGLFRDVGGRRLLGCTARESREGFEPKRHGGPHPPCPVDRWRDSLKQTPVVQFYEAFTRSRARWIRAGFIKRRGTYILAATQREVDGEEEGAGAMTARAETREAQGPLHRRQVVTKGFTWVTLSYLGPTRTLLVVMAYRVGPIPQHEGRGSDELSDEVVAAIGAGALRLLLLDRGGSGWRAPGTLA